MTAEFKADFGSGKVNAQPMVRNSANTGWQDCEAYVRNGSDTGWDKVWPLVAPLSASASPAALFGARIGAGSLSRTTTITASGGVPPYSYNTIWSAGGAGLSVINGGSSNPGASGSNSPTNTYTGTLRCRVTDAASNYVDVFISVEFSWEA